jgi:peptide/nickel transport system substrate-binding protein
VKRRDLLAASAAVAASGLAAPAIVSAQGARVLRFVPHADLTVTDPMVTTAYVTRNHAHLVWDTLYGVDEQLSPHPQLAEGHSTEDNGLSWTFTLRQGPVFHDGTPVRAADAVASVKRWALRDALGQELARRWDAIEALDDRRFRIRLKRPFAPMLDALAKPSSYACFVMPERLANLPPTQPIPELVGSGPYRFVANERVVGSRVVYQKFDGYVPRQGAASFTAGPKIAHIERIEWHVLPDAATAAAALQNNEIDWWEQPSVDLLPVLRRNRNVNVDVVEITGLSGIFRFNHLHPPFDNPAIRRALLPAISQADYMQAVAGTDPQLWRDNVGIFTPGTAMASTAGLEPLAGPRDPAAARAALAAAGYRGEPVLFMHATDIHSLNAVSQVSVAMLRAVGMNVEVATSDWGTVVQRRAKKEPPAQGGWNAFCTFFAGVDSSNPGVHGQIRGNGQDAWFGWPTAPRIEELRDQWFDAPSVQAQQQIAAELQRQFMQDLPYIPIGMYFQATAHRRNVTGLLKGLPLNWNVQKS